VDWDPEFPSTMPLGGTGLTVVWLAHDYTPYTVKHFFEDLNGNDVEDTNYEEHKTGTTDTLTNAQYAEVT
jgi:hypothetical protein